MGHAPHPDERDPICGCAARRHLTAGARNRPRRATRGTDLYPAYNALGIIEPQRVLADLTATGADEIWLGFEIAHRERHEVEPLVLPELIESARYWREFLPSDGPWQPEVNA